MKRIKSLIVLMVFSLTILSLFSLNAKTVSAQDAGYTIESVDHQIEVLYTGQVVVRDTIHVTGQLTGGFLIGFPYKYGSLVLKGVAYDANTIYPMSLGVELESRSGFYGAKVSFPNGSPEVFTVLFILSNVLVSPITNGFTLDFPAYPSFVEDAVTCNVTLVLPGVAAILNVTKSDGAVFTTNFVKDNLPAFTYSPAIATFNLPDVWLRLAEISTLDRKITISSMGAVDVSDSYRILNNQKNGLGFVEVGLSLNASNVVVRDESGRNLAFNVLPSPGTVIASTSGLKSANVTFALPLKSGESSVITIEYSLLSVSSGQSTRFSLDFALIPDANYFIGEVSATFVPPEGSRFVTPQLSSIEPSSSLTRGIFQETLSVRREGVSYVDYSLPSNNIIQVAYDYNPLWLSFRPTVWVWALAVVGCVFVAFWRRPKTSAPKRIAAPKASVELSPDHLSAFIEAYEEKSKLSVELKSLEGRAQKGRIPRRQYKVQRGMLEARFQSLSKNISGLKDIFRSAGGVYADLVRQLSVAERELDDVEASSRTDEARHNRGDLSLEDYKKLQADYLERREKAETKINGILLRLREEIH